MVFPILRLAHPEAMVPGRNRAGLAPGGGGAPGEIVADGVGDGRGGEAELAAGAGGVVPFFDQELVGVVGAEHRPGAEPLEEVAEPAGEAHERRGEGEEALPVAADLRLEGVEFPQGKRFARQEVASACAALQCVGDGGGGVPHVQEALAAAGPRHISGRRHPARSRTPDDGFAS